MIVEVIAVGTELLLGQIVNSNAATIGAALAERGFDAHFQQIVGDNVERIAASITLAVDRSDAVILTGGIGPTQDDITREALSAATGLELVFNEEYAEYLREWFASRGREMPESNLRQAFRPAGAELLINPRGTAPGLALAYQDKLIFCVPGVPAEMEYLLAHELIPRLVETGGEQVIASRLIRTWGRAESDIAGILDDLYESVNPSLAFLASAAEIKIRITAKAETDEEAQRLIEPMSAEVAARLGENVFGYGDDTIERILLRLLTERGWTIGAAESMTGGLVSARLSELPGSSAVFKGGLVAYHTELKGRLLGVKDLSNVVDVNTAGEMAVGARRLLETDVAVAVTGSAGPEPMEKPPGTVVIGVATPDEVRAKELRYVGDRERVRAYATTAALQLTRLALMGKWWRS